MRSKQRESIVIIKKFELEILTNLHVLDLPESEKHNFGFMSVCEHDNSKTIRDKGMKFVVLKPVSHLETVVQSESQWSGQPGPNHRRVQSGEASGHSGNQWSQPWTFQSGETSVHSSNHGETVVHLWKTSANRQNPKPVVQRRTSVQLSNLPLRNQWSNLGHNSVVQSETSVQSLEASKLCLETSGSFGTSRSTLENQWSNHRLSGPNLENQ
ncbi:hypothetical protein AVEN_15482-1 [Araneus ventricosus]|uniref:Uncharacterized protein n=1 Tax=Araneus ventricosus TaxID=182803 RepID=A0A4Y2IIA0_ARAVE|nr:hypothetical protein AVEN_15482-1 [Araneus ventricosus]